MTLGKWQGLKETESDVIRKTSGIHQRELGIIGKLLNAYLVGFEAIGSFTRDKDSDLQYAWLKLVTRSSNSMRCAMKSREKSSTILSSATAWPGFSPTQGHIASAVPYLGHAVRKIREGKLQNTMFLAKGSLFLGRMTQLADGLSFILERNNGGK